MSIVGTEHKMGKNCSLLRNGDVGKVGSNLVPGLVSRNELTESVYERGDGNADLRGGVALTDRHSLVCLGVKIDGDSKGNPQLVHAS